MANENDEAMVGLVATEDEIRELTELPGNNDGKSVEGGEGSGTQAPDPDPDPDPDAGTGGDDDHDDHEGDDTTRVDSELEAASTDEEREQIRSRRSQDRKNRKLRQRERAASLESQLQALQAQNAELAAQVAGIQSVNASAQLAQIDAGIQQAQQAAAHFKTVLADAVTKGDGKTVVEATEFLNQANNRAAELAGYKQRVTQATTAPRPLNPNMVRHAQEFMGKHKWYGGAESAEPDSRVLSAIDNSVAAEGWDPSTPAYWQELETRAKKYLPHRFSTTAPPAGGYNGATGGNERRAPNKNPVAGAGDRTSGKVADKNTVAISAERVKAMKDAGIWDDPVARKRTIENYRKYDANLKSNA